MHEISMVSQNTGDRISVHSRKKSPVCGANIYTNTYEFSRVPSKIHTPTNAYIESRTAITFKSTFRSN